MQLIKVVTSVNSFRAGILPYKCLKLCFALLCAPFSLSGLSLNLISSCTF